MTLSENLQGGLWVAEVVEGTETRVTMVPVTLGATTVASIRGPSVTLQRTLLMTEPDPVLDAQMFSIGGVQRLVVLEPERIVSYVRNAAVLAPAGAATGNWIEDQHFAIAHTRPFPRDLRGELVAAQDHLFDAYLPGALCSGTTTGAQIMVACGDSDDPWPVGGVAAGVLQRDARLLHWGVGAGVRDGIAAVLSGVGYSAADGIGNVAEQCGWQGDADGEQRAEAGERRE